MIRDQSYKLIEYRVGSARHTQLFDLHEDPWETRDLATQPGLQERRRELRAALDRWRHETGDTAPEFTL
jgi:arylsulfatase A-like enzyme